MISASLRKKLEAFTCWQCGNCCRGNGYVHVSDAESEAIAAHLGLTVEAFIERYTTLTRERRGLTLKDQEDPEQSCIFLQPDSTCAINDVKPQQCRDFPYKWRYGGWEKDCHNACAWPRK